MIEYWTTTEQARTARHCPDKANHSDTIFQWSGRNRGRERKKKVIGVREHGENAKTIQILHASTYFLSTVFFNNILYIIK
jgi:hypothetical protein